MRRLTKKAAGLESGGREEEDLFGSGFDGVAAFPILSFGGYNRQVHLLAQRGFAAN